MLQRLALVGGVAAVGYVLLKKFVERELSGIGTAFGGIGEGLGDLLPGEPVGDWADYNAPTDIRVIAAPVETLTTWPNLGNFLAAVSYTESRGNHNAGSSADNNDARGWFGLRPSSAKTVAYGFADPNILKSKKHAVAFAADYAVRLRNHASPGQVVDWLAIRRGWALPELVADTDESEKRSREVHQRFETALTSAGLPASFMHFPAFSPNFAWSGFASALAAVQGAAVS